MYDANAICNFLNKKSGASTKKRRFAKRIGAPRGKNHPSTAPAYGRYLHVCETFEISPTKRPNISPCLSFPEKPYLRPRHEAHPRLGSHPAIRHWPQPAGRTGADAFAHRAFSRTSIRSPQPFVRPFPLAPLSGQFPQTRRPQPRTPALALLAPPIGRVRVAPVSHY